MELTLESALHEKFMISFTGTHPPEKLLELLRCRPTGGLTLFRQDNIRHPEQVKQLTGALQQAAQSITDLPLLIAADQEGGQLMAVGEGATQFPGNMALGAAGSTDLAYRAGYATGRELAAMGINVNYAPVCDVNRNPNNPVVGTRSFGSDPAQVARLSAALVKGLQAAGVAATAKHFPGHGDTATDSHFGAPVLDWDENRLGQVELPPFKAAIEAGVRLVMTGHIALPALHGGAHIPATLSPAVLRGLLRERLAFTGLIASDALDMKAIQQGPGLAIDVIAAAAAGVDLLLLKHDPESNELLYRSMLQAVQHGLLTEEDILASAGRVQSLKEWLNSQVRPPLEVVGCAEHRELALEIACRSITLVRDTAGILPVRIGPKGRIAVVMPEPADLTPADTSSYVTPLLAQALRGYHPTVDEFIIPLQPVETDIAALRLAVQDYDLVVIGTINAIQYAGQAALVRTIVECGIPMVAVALRLPYDVQVYPPSTPACICTYSLLPPSFQALAKALWGEIPFAGHLPVAMPEG